MTHVKKIILPALAAFAALALSGCYFGANDWGGPIEKEFHFTCWDEHCKIAFSTDDAPDFFKTAAIEQSVVAMGHNSDFIIAKQHPHLDGLIYSRLFQQKHSLSGNMYYELKHPKDSIYLLQDDSIFFELGTWFHTKHSWTDPDSLRPYKKITLYHIIDLRSYDEGYRHYVFNNETDYNNKRLILAVPEELGYSYDDETPD